MSRITLKRTIDAPEDAVFSTVADIRNFSKAIPEIVDIEFLTGKKSGVGTRFKETREINGKRASTELEVTEYEENRRIRLVADSHGTVWDSLFSVEPSGERTELKLVMEARPYKLLTRLLNPVMKFFIRKAIARDMDVVKGYCESDRPEYRQ